MAKNGKVYVFRALGTPYFKIGYTTCDPLKRLSQAQTDCPHVLEVYSTIETDDVRRLEKDMHNELEFCNVHGEWFALPEYKMIALIDKVSEPIGGNNG